MECRIPSADRQRIVGRADGSTTRLTVRAIQSPDELAYAVRYLMDYYTYQRSKQLGVVNSEAAGEAARAVETALQTFADEIPIAAETETDELLPVSPLTDGKIVNPWANVGAQD